MRSKAPSPNRDELSMSQLVQLKCLLDDMIEITNNSDQAELLAEALVAVQRAVDYRRRKKRLNKRKPK